MSNCPCAVRGCKMRLMSVAIMRDNILVDQFVGVAFLSLFLPSALQGDSCGRPIIDDSDWVKFQKGLILSHRGESFLRPPKMKFY